MIRDEEGLCLDRADIEPPPMPETGGSVTDWANEVSKFLGALVTCSMCGSVVHDKEAHDRFHRKYMLVAVDT